MAVNYAEAIDSLEEALAMGVLSAVINGRTVTYGSAADMKERLSYFKTQLATASNKSSLKRIKIGKFTG